MEQILKQPYTQEKERPYHLHAIMIHDGLAENGHYYTYVFDRAQKVWWKLNDHNVSQEKEETVLKEAFGGEGYKSACNVIYISKHISDQLESYAKPVYTSEHAKLFKVTKAIKDEIKKEHYAFELSNQSLIID